MKRIVLLAAATFILFNIVAQNLSSSNLPIVIIDTKGKSIPDEPKINASMKIINNEGKDNSINDADYEYNGNIGIEVRGNTSQIFFKDKLSYTVETRTGENSNLNVSIMGMPEENDWVLYGPYSDKSLMRNVIAYYLGNQTGRWSPRTRYCELVLNNEYKGIYVFTEKIKIDNNRVDIATLKETDVSGDELTGGYIMRIDRDRPGSWNSPFMGRTGSVDVPISYYDPKYDELKTEQKEYIRKYITDFEYALDGANFKDPEKGYRAYIDVISWIDYYLITELARDLDGYRVSVYFHKDKDSNGGKLTMSPLWDYNLCFGNADFFDADDPVGTVAEGLGSGDWYEIPFWWDRLREDPYFETYLKWRWESLRKYRFTIPKIYAVLDSCAGLLNEAQQRNFERFDILDKHIWPNSYIGHSFQNEVDYLKNWFYERIDWMDTEISKIKPAFVNIETPEIISNVSTYPNPFEDIVNFRFSLNTNNKVSISFFNMLGEKVYEENKECFAGNNIIQIETVKFYVSDKLFFYKIEVDEQVTYAGKILTK